jgi:ferric-dicitrate binding protein FerR (iron transport regulator)
MSADDHQQWQGAPSKGVIGSDRAVVSRLPAPPNARVDGLDARTAGLAAFVASAVEAQATGVEPGARAVETLLASRVQQARRRRTRRTTGIGLGVLAAGGFVAWTAVSHLPPKLSYTVDGAAPPPDGDVRSSAGHEPELVFSDGSNVRVMRSGRARVLDVGRRGARLMLEDGRAHVQVAHRPGADWHVQAGAFQIHVHGTAFFVEWNASQSRFDLQMESGVVSVDGPRPGDTVVVRGGQSLSLRLDGSRAVATTQATLAAHGSTVPGRETPPRAVEAPPPESTAADAPSLARSTAPSRARWSERLLEGGAAGIVAEAQRRGIASVLAETSSEDLAALADAARFRKQDELARRVLLAQRRRFQGTLRAEEASFLLGRLADGPGGRASDALAWYDLYLREAPSGAYAAEAMGRRMLVLERQHRTDEARAVATAYLRRFPQGAYARAARAVASPDRE